MTVIVGVPDDGRVVLGADSRTTGGQIARSSSEGKLWRRGGMVFGLTGSPREQQILVHATTLPALPKPRDLSRWLCCEFVSAMREARKACGYDERSDGQAGVEAGPNLMVGAHGRIFVVFCDYQVTEWPTGMAIGSGEGPALGSLHATARLDVPARRRVNLAVEAACAHDIYCAPPIKIIASRRPR